MDYEAWAERRMEELDMDLFEYLLNNRRASEDFLIFLEEQDKGMIQSKLNEWLKTKDGIKWYEDTLERLIEDRPEMEPEDMPGSER